MQSREKIFKLLYMGGIGLAGFLFFQPAASAHCDTMDGPVIKSARQALATADVTPALRWVQKDREKEIRSAFKQAVRVRKKGVEARSLADRYFFETLVRVHRAGEGAPYTGLKPSGTAIEPAISEADRAIETGSVERLVRLLTQEAGAGIRKRFAHLRETKKQANKSVESGREYVEAYVEFTHYVEQLHRNIAGTAAGHGQQDSAPHQE